MSQNNRRSNWLRKTSKLAEEIEPKIAGRIHWDTATHLYNIGDSPQKAAKELVTTFNNMNP